MDPSVGTPTQGAKRGVKNKKSRDSETTGPPPQAAASIGNTRSKQKGYQPHHKKANTPYRPHEIPTNKDTEPTVKDEINSPAKTEETSNLLHQAGTDLVGSPTGYEGHCPHGRTGKPERPDKESMRQDSGNAPKQRQLQPHQMDRIALNGTEPSRVHPTTQKVGRGPLSGPNAQEPDGLSLDPQSASTGFAESTYTASSGPGIRREKQLAEKRDTHTTVTSTLPIEGAKAALPGVVEPVSENTKDNEPVPTLTQAETTSIEKRRRRQARAGEQAKNSTACFHLGTPILVQKNEKAIWIPIYKAEVVQSLPSEIIEDLTDALMTKIETICVFDCPTGGIDIVQMGEALITAHHHIQIADGWMTARQAAHLGHGALYNNFSLPRVYSLCLEGGGNIIINTTAHPQDAPTLTMAATMGCRFEPAEDTKHKGFLTYPVNIRVGLGQISGMKSGHKHFKANEVETRSNGEIIFKTIPTMEIEPPIPDKNRPETPLRPSTHDTITLHTRVLASKTIAHIESATAIEMDKKAKKGELNTRPIGPPDTTHSDTTTCLRPPEELLSDRDATKEDLPKPSLTPDTYILISNGEKALWIHLWTAVVQSLPSEKIGDL